MNHQIIGHTLVTAPATALLTLAEAKAQASIDTSDHDTWLASLIATATERLDGPEGILGRALITQTWRAYLDAAPVGPLILPIPRVQSIAEIGYIDADGATQTLDAANYRLFSARDTAWIELTRTGSWPALDDRSGALWVDYVTGYGDAASDVPMPIRQAALLLMSHLFLHREAVAETRTYVVHLAESALLAPYRVVGAHF